MSVATPVKERVFGEGGETIEETVIDQEIVEEEVIEEVVETEEVETEEPAAPAPAAHKYRIGDKTFATQAEALTYAESQVSSTSEVDAYRQVLREAISAVPRSEPVTQTPKPVDNAEELYTNPDEYLRKRDERVKAEVLQTVQQHQAANDADNRTWRDFVDRHPDLIEFREEITMLVARIQPEVQTIGRSKGQAAAYDYVATKFKAQVDRINAALKPKRTLKEGGAGTPTGTKTETVTPKKGAVKPLSFVEQLKQTRKGRR